MYYEVKCDKNGSVIFNLKKFCFFLLAISTILHFPLFMYYNKKYKNHIRPDVYL